MKYPLSNLLRCSNDNYSFRRRSRIYEPTGYEYTYWSCSKRDYGVAECDNKIKVDEKEMERAIVNFLISLFQNGQIIREKFKKKVRKELSMRYESVYNIESLTAEKKKLEAKRDKLMDLYVEDGIDKEAVMAKIIPIDKRLSEINQIIEVYYQQDHVTSDIEKRLVEITDRIDDHLGNLLDNAFLKSIFEKFVVYPDGKVVAYIKIDKDTGEVLEIPFAELVDKKEVSVPNYTADI